MNCVFSPSVHFHGAASASRWSGGAALMALAAACTGGVGWIAIAKPITSTMPSLKSTAPSSVAFIAWALGT